MCLERPCLGQDHSLSMFFLVFFEVHKKKIIARFSSRLILIYVRTRMKNITVMGSTQEIESLIC